MRERNYIVKANTRTNHYSWPDADTSGTTEKEKYCILNTTNSRLHHIRTPSLNQEQYQRICVISLNSDKNAQNFTASPQWQYVNVNLKKKLSTTNKKKKGKKPIFYTQCTTIKWKFKNNNIQRWPPLAVFLQGCKSLNTPLQATLSETNSCSQALKNSH